jgi:hypothetical protein
MGGAPLLGAQTSECSAVSNPAGRSRVTSLRYGIVQHPITHQPLRVRRRGGRCPTARSPDTLNLREPAGLLGSLHLQAVDDEGSDDVD